MTLILLAISLTITFCVIAWHLAIYALPVMTCITAFQYVYATGSGFWSIEPSISTLLVSDPAVIFANISYLHSFSKDIDKTIEGFDRTVARMREEGTV